MSTKTARAVWIARVVRAAERAIKVPPGWWGSILDATNGRARVKWSKHASRWILRIHGKIIGRYVVRATAIRAAQASHEGCSPARSKT